MMEFGSGVILFTTLIVAIIIGKGTKNFLMFLLTMLVGVIGGAILFALFGPVGIFIILVVEGYFAFSLLKSVGSSISSGANAKRAEARRAAIRETRVAAQFAQKTPEEIEKEAAGQAALDAKNAEKNARFDKMAELIREKGFDGALDSYVSLDAFKNSCGHIIKSAAVVQPDLGARRDCIAAAARMVSTISKNDDDRLYGLNADGTVLGKRSSKNYATGISRRSSESFGLSSDIIHEAGSGIVALAKGTKGTGLRADGSVVWGNDYQDRNVTDDEWFSLYKEDRSTRAYFGIPSDGTVYITGVLGTSITGRWSNMVELAMPNALYVGLRRDGTVIAKTSLTEHSNKVKMCRTASSWKNIITTLVSYDKIVGLKSDGTVVVASDDVIGDDKKLMSATSWKGVVAIAFYGGLVGLLADGSLVSTDSRDTIDEMGDGFISIDSTCGFFVGIKADGTVTTTRCETEGHIVPGLKLW